MSFLLRLPIFRLYVKFPGCTNFHHDPTKVCSPSPSIYSTPRGQGRLLLHNQRHGDMDYTPTQGSGQRCPRNIPGPWHRFTKEHNKQIHETLWNMGLSQYQLVQDLFPPTRSSNHHIQQPTWWYGCFPKYGNTPKWMVKIMEHPH